MIDRMLPLFALPILAVLIVLIPSAVLTLNKRHLPPVSLPIGAGILTWALGEILVSIPYLDRSGGTALIGQVFVTAGPFLISLTLVTSETQP